MNYSKYKFIILKSKKKPLYIYIKVKAKKGDPFFVYHPYLTFFIEFLSFCFILLYFLN